tara:strand:+ start:12651 stop:14675 length:2025 start_codon:yes stop_codon:yes gene_type:complete
MTNFLVHSQSKIEDDKERENLDEVIVTATRTERQLSSIPLPAQLISSKQIKQTNSVRLDDILTEQTGLSLVYDHGLGIQMQGMDSEYVMILIDGNPMIGRTAGTFDLSRISVGNIEQIEIVKGPSSSLYGSEAMAGVINIITKKPKNGFHGNLDNRYSSFNTVDMNVGFEYQYKKLGMTFHFNRYSSDGYDLDKSDLLKTFDSFINYTVNNKIEYAFDTHSLLTVSNRFYTEDQTYIPNAELQGMNYAKEYSNSIKYEKKFSDTFKGTMDVYGTHYETSSYLNNLDGSRNSDSFFKQLLVRPEVRLEYTPSDSSSIMVGIGTTYQTVDRTYFSNKPAFVAPYYYGQWDITTNNNLNIIIGARYDDHSEYRSQFSPKLAIGYDITDAISIKGSIGYGYKAPNFRQLYLDFTNPLVGYSVLGYNLVTTRIPEMQANGLIASIKVPLSDYEEALVSESSQAFNLGVSIQVIESLKFDVNFFRNNHRDMIDTQVIASKINGQNTFSYINRDDVYTKGIEINTQWAPHNYLKFSGGYQLLYAKDKTTEKAIENGEKFVRVNNTSVVQLKKNDYIGLFNRSKHTFNAKVFYEIPELGTNVNLRVIYRSKYGLFDSNNNEIFDVMDDIVAGYAIWNTAINQELNKNCSIGLGIDNLFNFTDPQNINSIPGRIAYGKINYQF